MAGLFNLPGSFPLGSIFGIPIRLHVLFLVLLVAQVVGNVYYGAQYMFLWFVLLGPVLLLTILIHELGHCLAARHVGGEVQGILLWPMGGLAFVGHTAGPKADIWVAVAGPLTHVPMVAVWLLLLLPAYHANTGSWAINLHMPYPDWHHMWQAICVGAVVMNIALCVFNLLVPAYPLDGGRILVGTLLAAGVSNGTTAKVTVGVAAPLGVGLLVFGCIVFQPVTIMVALWMLWSTYQLFREWRQGSLDQHPLFAFSGEAASSGGAGNYAKFAEGARV